MTAVIPNIPKREYKVVPREYLSGNRSVSAWLQENVTARTTVYAPDGIIAVDSANAFSGIDNVRITGPGVWTCVEQFTGAVFDLTNCDNWELDRAKFNLAASDFATVAEYQDYFNLAVRAQSSSNLKITGCEIDDVYTFGIWIYTCTGRFFITDNILRHSSQEKQKAGAFIALLESNGIWEVMNNRLLAEMPTVGGVFNADYGMAGLDLAGLNASFGHLNAQGNTFDWCGRNNDFSHRIGCIDLYGNVYGATFRGNNLLNCPHQGFRVSRSHDVTIDGNTIEHYGPGAGDVYNSIYSGPDTLAPYVFTESRDIEFINNSLRYVGPQSAYASQSGALQSWCIDDDHAVKDVTIRGNTFENFIIGINTIGSHENLDVDSNQFIDVQTPHVRGVTSIYGTATNRRFKGISYKNNKIRRKVLFHVSASASTDVFTTTSPHGLAAEFPIYLRNLSSEAAGVVSDTRYFLRDVTTYTFKLESSIGGGAIDITSNITGEALRRPGATGGIGLSDSTFTGKQDTIVIENNIYEGGGSGQGIITLNQDVILRGNQVDNVNIALYCRGASTNTIRKFGNVVTNSNQVEDFSNSVVINEEREDAALDITSLSPVFAWSIDRKLMPSFAGNCMEVRESGGDTLEDIGFLLKGSRDTTALLTHTSGVNGFVRTIYDQSGNSNDLQQTTITPNNKQAQVVLSGDLLRVGGKNGLLGTAFTAYNGGSFTLTDFTVFAVCYFSDTSQALFNIPSGSDQNSLFCIGSGGSGALTLRRGTGGDATATIPTGRLLQVTAYSSNSLRQIWVNGISEATDSNTQAVSNTSDDMWLMAIDASTYNMAGWIHEIYIIPGSISAANRQLLIEDQINYFSVAT